MVRSAAALAADAKASEIPTAVAKAFKILTAVAEAFKILTAVGAVKVLIEMLVLRLPG